MSLLLTCHLSSCSSRVCCTDVLCCVSAVLRVSDSTTRLRLARLNEKLSRLERQMDYLEASVQNVAEASAEAQRQQAPTR